MSIPSAKLKFWANNDYNVCFVGKHGVGKTSIIKDLFDELYGVQGEDWLYFSASTMDPWVDFVGVPKDVTAPDGVQYLTLIRPEMFARDKVKAIFMDEFNRAPEKVRNAVMELLQFKSINGHRFNNLKIVWTAINPSDEDEYDVDEIDPAQLDRFHVMKNIAYSVSKKYFVDKYGEKNGTAAVSWWNSLPEKSKNLVSPRRLDYAIDCFSKGGDLRDILPSTVNPKNLIIQLNSGTYIEKLKNIFDDKDDKKAELAMSDYDFIETTFKEIIKSQDYIKYFFKFLPEEVIVQFICKTRKSALQKIIKHFPTSKNVKDALESIVGNNKTTTAPKTKMVRDWVLNNWPDSELGFDIKLKMLLDEAHRNAKREVTYHRINRIEEIIDYIRITNVSYNPNLVKSFYDYLIIAMSRSQLPTQTKILTKKFYSAMEILDKIVCHKTYLKSKGISINHAAYKASIK